MKLKPLFLGIFLMSIHAIFAQQHCIELQKNNNLFLGFENKVKILVDSTSCDSISVEIDNGNIEKIDSANCFIYKINPNKVGIANITIKLKDKQPITKKYRVIREKPIATIHPDYINKNKIKAREIKAQSGLQAAIANSDFDINIVVDKFDIIVLRGNYLVMRYENKGAKFLPIIYEKLQQVRPDDLIIFSDIFVRMPDNRKFRIEPIEYILE